MTPTPAALHLTDARKTACLACRKRKIRCHLVNDNPPCTRCKHRGIECAFDKSLGASSQEDDEWKKRLEERLSNIERHLNAGSVSTTTSTLPNIDQTRQESNTVTDRPGDRYSPQVDDTTAELNLSCSLSSFPAASINGTIQDDSPRVISGPAIAIDSPINPIPQSQNMLGSLAAEDYFSFYQTKLDPLIHYILKSGQTFANLKQRSAFLAIAACTVAAYCTGASDYDRWAELYKALASARTFAKQHAFDDVRALCIGAFWLHQDTTALNALAPSTDLYIAVRLSTELNLHRCLNKIPFPNAQCYERTRLYFQVYVVDHHCALCYGRPPMTREFSSLENARAFLGSEFSNPDRGDTSLVSQVELWSNNAKVFDVFGADIERTTPSYVDSIHKLNCLYDNWLNDWRPILSPMGHLLRNSIHGTTQLSRTADNLFSLYISAAKLQLFSHVFRGPAQRSPHPPITLDSRDGLTKFARQAVHCAVDQLDGLISMVKAGDRFGILPAYLATTIAFSSVFLSRVLTSQNAVIVNEHVRTICGETIQKLCIALQGSTDEATRDGPASSNSRLILSKIVDALKSAMETICTDESHLDVGDTSDYHVDQYRGFPFGIHDPHDVFDANGFDLFGVDMSLNFDFDFMNEDASTFHEAGQ